MHARSQQSAEYIFFLKRIEGVVAATREPNSAIHLRAVSGLSEQFRDLIAADLHDQSTKGRRKRDIPNACIRSTKAMANMYGVDLKSRVEPLSHLLVTQSITEATRWMVDAGLHSVDYLLAFAEAYRIQRERLCKPEEFDALHQQTHPLCALSLSGFPGKNDQREKRPWNHEILSESRWANYLRIIAAREAIPYNTLHEREFYLFTTQEHHSHFAEQMANYRGGEGGRMKLIEGKRILSLAAGNGRDEFFYARKGAEHVRIIEGSAHMLKRMHAKYAQLPSQDRRWASRIKIPSAPEDMFAALQECEYHGEIFDTIVAHSAVHYFDNNRLHELLMLVRKCLRYDGHFCFAVKAPGAPLDSPESGIPFETVVYRRPPKGQLPGKEIVEKRSYLNWDSQMRVFRDRELWRSILEQCGLTVKDDREAIIEDYDTPGEQVFYYFIARKEPGYLD